MLWPASTALASFPIQLNGSRKFVMPYRNLGLLLYGHIFFFYDIGSEFVQIYMWEVVHSRGIIWSDFLLWDIHLVNKDDLLLLLLLPKKGWPSATWFSPQILQLICRNSCIPDNVLLRFGFYLTILFDYHVINLDSFEPCTLSTPCYFHLSYHRTPMTFHLVLFTKRYHYWN